MLGLVRQPMFVYICIYLGESGSTQLIASKPGYLSFDFKPFRINMQFYNIVTVLGLTASLAASAPVAPNGAVEARDPVVFGKYFTQ